MGDVVLRGGESARGRSRLLAISGIAPWPRRGGFSLRAAHLLEHLAAEWDISLIVTARCESASVPWTRMDPHEIVGVPSEHDWTAVPSERPAHEALDRAVTGLMERHRFRAALLWPGTELVALGRHCFPPTVVDRIDCDTLDRSRAFFRRRASLKEIWRSARYERRVARQAGVTVVAGDDDARVLRRISGSKNVALVRNGVVPETAARFEAESPIPTVVFSGTLNYYANVDAVRHFARRIWPDIRRQVPAARLLIAGRTPSRQVLALERIAGVEILAEVPDMTAVLQQAWVAVAPMRLGAGVKNKVLEAWAAGRPVVLTPLAANGLQLEPDMRQWTAKRRDVFAGLVIKLLTRHELRHGLGSAALASVRANHSWKSSADALSRLLRAVSG